MIDLEKLKLILQSSYQPILNQVDDYSKFILTVEWMVDINHPQQDPMSQEYCFGLITNIFFLLQDIVYKNLGTNWEMKFH